MNKQDIINILLKLSPALEAGQQLEHADTWANVNLCNHAIVSVMGFCLMAIKLFGIETTFNEDDIVTYAGLISSVCGPIAMYLHAATNADRGFKRNV